MQTKFAAAMSTFPFLTFSKKVKHHKSEVRTPDVASSVLRRCPQEKELLGEYCLPNQLFQHKVQKGITLINLDRARTSQQENCLESVALLDKPGFVCLPVKICPQCQGILVLADFKFRIPILSYFGSCDEADLAVWFYDLFV